MLTILTALALAQQTAPAPASDPRACIIDGLAPLQRVELAKHFDAGELQAMLTVAKPAADACATQHKWDDSAREWHIVHNASYAAMLMLESQLPKTIPTEKLEGLFGKLSEQDRYGFTLQGSAALDNAAYAALAGRAGALMEAEKFTATEINTAGRWFLAYARFLEAGAHLAGPPR